MLSQRTAHTFGYALLSAFFLFAFTFLSPKAFADSSVSVWWPTDGAHVSGVQPFKAMLSGSDVSQYDMFWQVDGGSWNWMDDNYADHPHKEASVDLSGWNWHGSGPYTVNFIARKNGVVVAQSSVDIYIGNGTKSSTTNSASVVTAAKTVKAQNTPATSNAYPYYIDPSSDAAKQEMLWQNSNPAGASAMSVLAAQPTAVWFGGWNTDIQNDVHMLVEHARAKNQMPVLVAYNIPERDCGGFSAGGSNDPSGYISWIQSFAAGIGSDPATVILEPDALADISCLSQSDQNTRLQLMKTAVSALKQHAGTKVYLDAGHSGWIDAGTMARSLEQAGISSADGFSLNVSNFDSTSIESAYGKDISAKIGGKHFVVDTSRNGNGSTGDWCNPQGAAIGEKPANKTGDPLIDAFLWIKTPGESDGNCNGGPGAGTWWPDYAVKLVQNSH